MTDDDFICEICGAVQTVTGGRYGAWKCASCGQEYRYDEGPMPVLTDEQKRVLREMRLDMHAVDARDAARYRWLRENLNSYGVREVNNSLRIGLTSRCEPDVLDAAVDASMRGYK